jgi:ribosomal protein S20
MGSIETVPLTKSALKDYTVVYTLGNEKEAYQFTQRAVSVIDATAKANVVLLNTRKRYEIVSVTKDTSE